MRMMLHSAARLAVLVLSLFVLSMVLGGCSYLKARGNDALDIVDLGVTVTPRLRPDFSLYLDYFNLTPLGYGHFDGKLLGLGNRHAGAPGYEYSTWGLVVWGSERQGAGPFNPADPHQARRDERDAVERQRYDAGLVRVFAGNSPPPWPHHAEVCRKIHLGWIGIAVTARPVDLLDFILGWTTLDILQDDHIPRPVEAVG